MGCLKLEILEKYDNLKITFRAKNSVFLGDLDYYPFGMQMPGRSFNSSSYRFGYNAGSEKDDEITGVTGSHFTTFFREFDTRILKPWTPDPVFQPWQSPYSSMDNNPIWFNDPLGDVIGDYYKKDGTWVGSDGIDDKKAYVVNNENAPTVGEGNVPVGLSDYRQNGNGQLAKHDGTSYNAIEDQILGGKTVDLLGISHPDFLKLAGVSYGESVDYSDKESWGIANAIVNNANEYRNGSISKTLTGNFAYAMGHDRYQSFLNSSSSTRNSNSLMKNAIAGSINAFSGGVDYSNGGTFWDGIDILSKGSSHYRYQYAADGIRKGISDPSFRRSNFRFNAYMYAKGAFGSGSVYKSLHKPLLTVEESSSTLWRITSTQGATLFYRELNR